MLTYGFKLEGFQRRRRINTSLHINKVFDEKCRNCFDLIVLRVEELWWFGVHVAFELFYVGSLVRLF